MKNLFKILFAAALLAGCDYVDDPIPPGGGGENGGNDTVLRTALLEEFTGHRCATCPAAHAVVQQLSNLFGERLVIVGIHATNTFGAPLQPPAADGRYSTDFRTPAGDAYTSNFGVSFLPTGIVSRKPYNSTLAISQGSWGSAISNVLEQPAFFSIGFEDMQVNTSNNTLNATVKIHTEKAIDADHKLTIYLVEDNVIDWQLNGPATPPDVPDYVHRHVLRGAVNGTWGEDVVPAGTAAESTFSVAVSAFPLKPEWNVTNCYLVAYVYQTSSKEVMQVAQQKIRP